jgi:hypothetical protein
MHLPRRQVGTLFASMQLRFSARQAAIQWQRMVSAGSATLQSRHPLRKTDGPPEGGMLRKLEGP